MNATLLATPSRSSSHNGHQNGQTNGKTVSPWQWGRDVNREGRRIKELIDRIATLPDPEARELLQDCLQSVLALHGAGLARILELVKNAGAAGGEVNDAILRDRLVSGLLLVHGLHPISLEARLRLALDKVRPYMKSHGGDVQLLCLKDDVATLSLTGTCKSCPSSSVTMELAVRQAIEEACPDLAGLQVEGMVDQSPTVDHRPADETTWTVVDDLGNLEEGDLRCVKVSNVPVLFLKANGHLYAYRDLCPACESPLGDALFESNLLSCRLGHRFDVQRAGLSPDNPEIHLQPFPLLVANGMVRISVR